MYYYAQINESGTVIGISQLSGPVEGANMILLTEEHFASDILGRRYDADTGVFVAPEPPEPEAIPEPAATLESLQRSMEELREKVNALVLLNAASQGLELNPEEEITTERILSKLSAR